MHFFLQAAQNGIACCEPALSRPVMWLLLLSFMLPMGSDLGSRFRQVDMLVDVVDPGDRDEVMMVAVGRTLFCKLDLVGAVDNLQVRQEALDNAMRLVHINEQRLNIGTAAAIEVLSQYGWNKSARDCDSQQRKRSLSLSPRC